MKDCINKALIAGTCAALLCAASGGAPGRISDGKPFVHPGITYTQGDIDRMRSMIAAGRQPWKRCFDALRNAQTSNPWQGVRTRGGTIPQGQHNNTIGWDGRCAHDLALMWRLSDDERYADTAVRILNENAKWESSSGAGTGPLDNGKIFLLVEAAELMRDYPGWADEDRAKFGETLRNVFYRHIRSGDSSRWGNQGLTAFRGTLAMAIFLDDAKMYDRVWNYLNGLDRRPDDDDPLRRDASILHLQERTVRGELPRPVALHLRAFHIRCNSGDVLEPGRRPVRSPRQPHPYRTRMEPSLQHERLGAEGVLGRRDGCDIPKRSLL